MERSYGGDGACGSGKGVSLGKAEPGPLAGGHRAVRLACAEEQRLTQQKQWKDIRAKYMQNDDE